MSEKIKHLVQPRNPSRVGLLSKRDAAAYLGVSVRWLESNPAVPRVNLAQPGRSRAMWRYRVGELDEFAASRRTEPQDGR